MKKLYGMYYKFCYLNIVFFLLWLLAIPYGISPLKPHCNIKKQGKIHIIVWILS